MGPVYGFLHWLLGTWPLGVKGHCQNGAILPRGGKNSDRHGEVNNCTIFCIHGLIIIRPPPLDLQLSELEQSTGLMKGHQILLKEVRR